MDSDFRLFTILVSGTSDDTLRLTEEMIDRTPHFRALAVGKDRIAALDSKTIVASVVLDLDGLGSEEVDLINDVRAKFEDVPIVIISKALDEEQTRHLIKLQVHDWLRHPVDPSKLVKSVQSGIRNTKIGTNRVHAIVSGCAGAGATTLAISMAGQLAGALAKKGQSAALFDLDFSTGDCGYALNMANNFDLKGVLTNPNRVDAEFVNLIQQRHVHRFYVYSFKRPEVITSQNGYELVLRMLDAVNIQHEETILDLPYYETEWRSDVLGAVNTCTVVTELNLPALKHAVETVRSVRRLRGEGFPIRVVINKSRSSMFGGKIGKSKIKEIFGDTEVHFIPRDDKLIEESLDRGVLPFEIAPRSAFLKAVKSYLKLLVAEEALVE